MRNTINVLAEHHHPTRSEVFDFASHGENVFQHRFADEAIIDFSSMPPPTILCIDLFARVGYSGISQQAGRTGSFEEIGPIENSKLAELAAYTFPIEPEASEVGLTTIKIFRGIFPNTPIIATAYDMNTQTCFAGLYKDRAILAGASVVCANPRTERTLRIALETYIK